MHPILMQNMRENVRNLVKYALKLVAIAYAEMCEQ